MNSDDAKTVAIDCFAESVAHYPDDHVIVAVDVIRATTTVATCLAMGRRCYTVPSLESAFELAARLTNPLLTGELGGITPRGFELTNSPAQLARRHDVERPMILLSTGGTQLISAVKGKAACYAASLRNYTAQAEHILEKHSKVAIIGAGSLGEFREEDQMCCAWIASRLLSDGFSAANYQTAAIIRRWEGVPVDAFLISNSVAYLARSGQLEDLDYILAHINDLQAVFALEGEEIVAIQRPRTLQAAAGGCSPSKRPGRPNYAMC